MLRAISVIFLLVSLIVWYTIICDTFGFTNLTDNYFNLTEFLGSGIWLVGFIGIFLTTIFWWLGSNRY